MDEQSLRERNLCSTWWRVCNPQAASFDAASIADSLRWRTSPASNIPEAASAAIWPFVGDLEGDVLLTPDGTSGITVSDLLSVLAGVTALIQATRIGAAMRRNPPNTVTLLKSPEQFTTRAEPALLPLHTVSPNFPENPGQLQGTVRLKLLE